MSSLAPPNMNEEMKLYQKIWMRMHRAQPFYLETKVQRKHFKRLLKNLGEGRCPFCEIYIAEQPTHNCLESGLDKDKLLDVFGDIFDL